MSLSISLYRKTGMNSSHRRFGQEVSRDYVLVNEGVLSTVPDSTKDFFWQNCDTECVTVLGIAKLIFERNPDQVSSSPELELEYFKQAEQILFNAFIMDNLEAAAQKNANSLYRITGCEITRTENRIRTGMTLFRSTAEVKEISEASQTASMELTFRVKTPGP